MLEFIKFAVGRKKKNKKQTGVLDASAKRSSGNTTSRNEVINHILY